MYLWRYQATTDWIDTHENLVPKRMAIVIRPGRLRSLVQVHCQTRTEAARLRRRFGGTIERLGRDWETRYLQPPRAPLRVGGRLFILTSPAPTPQPQLVIPAAGAFGTGEHVTTAMCLRLLEEATRQWPPGWRLLDAGTGSGILALAARRFGARAALGFDLDRRAVAHARANARSNKIGKVQFVRQDLLRWRPNARFDLVTANLFSDLLITAAPKFRRALSPVGVLIVSGILREQAGSVIRALRAAGFGLGTQRRRGKWVALAAVPSRKS